MEKLSAKELTDSGICPTCYDREHDHCVFGDNSDKIVYSCDLFECFLCDNPRADGHMIISSKTHYKDMMEAPAELCKQMFSFAREAMIAIKKVYGSESVYLCTMCDGPMNHFHLQLIPRYAFEERGSKNFVKPRKEFVLDQAKLEKLKRLLAIKKEITKQNKR